MPLKIVRNDITKMKTEAIVNTANDHPTVGTGCDGAVYKAAGYEKLLAYRTEKVGFVPEGDAFITPGFDLPQKWIIHAVSPHYIDGKSGEEEKLRSCYRKSLALAKEYDIRSIAFPLISTGGFGYPKDMGFRIATDEINAFLMSNDMDVALVVFDEELKKLAARVFPKLQEYINEHYVSEKELEEYGEGGPDFLRNKLQKSSAAFIGSTVSSAIPSGDRVSRAFEKVSEKIKFNRKETATSEETEVHYQLIPQISLSESVDSEQGFLEDLEEKLKERMEHHRSDTFPEYMEFLAEEKGFKSSEVYMRACVTKQVYSKIKNNPDYHPSKLTVLQLCVGLQLNMDEAKDFLARAGYALSPCDKVDLVFAFAFENSESLLKDGSYEIPQVDIWLEDMGLPTIIKEF